jgi:hypothetical protein
MRCLGQLGQLGRRHARRLTAFFSLDFCTLNQPVKCPLVSKFSLHKDEIAHGP